MRSDYGELESTLTKMKIDLHSTASNQTKDRKRVHELSEEVNIDEIKQKYLYYTPHNKVVGGYWFHHVRPSVCRQILCRTIT